MTAILILGAPGSGKGTVVARLAKHRKFIAISSGDMLRAAVALQTPAGVEAQGYMRRGELVPDAIIGRKMSELLHSGPPDAHYVLDGFPRTVAQLEMLETTLAECNGTIEAAILLEVPEATLVERIAGRRICSKCKAVYHVKTLKPRQEGICDLCGGALVQRDDDQPVTVAQRLAVNTRQTVPVIAACAARRLLKRVDGCGDADTTVKLILQALG